MKKGLFILVSIMALAIYASQSKALPVVEEAVQQIVEPTVEPGLSTRPSTVIQGEPVLVVVNDLGTSTIKSLTFNSKAVNVFQHENKSTALIGLDLRLTPGTYPLALILEDGRKIEKKLVVGKRVIVEEPLGIPEKLGGNTPASEQELLNTLAQEGVIINSIPTANAKLWKGTFRLPLEPPLVVTDTYGYSRVTGASTLAHKGTDYRAKVGTPVYAMNSGTVRYADFLRNYGHVVVVDHGLGLQSIYMHLSERLVKLGESVEKGTLIAKSGDTGYVLGPHLHLTIKIGGISVDPLKFMELLGD